MGKQLTKRILVISDTHCGHRVGLTPPGWWASWPETNPKQQKISMVQRETWEWFERAVKQFKPYTHLFHLGDAIDGRGERSGGTEQKSMDRSEQADMAAFIVNSCEAPKVVMVAGTPYHVGTEEDWEAEVVPRLKADEAHFEGHAFPVVNGVQFDLKHFVGNSGVPHGRFTAIARDKMWNDLWYAEHERQPKSQVILRGHVHEYRCCEKSYWEAVTCPALQGYGSKFGVRKCSGTVDIGILVYEVASDGTWRRIKVLSDLGYQKVQPLQL